MLFESTPRLGEMTYVSNLDRHFAAAPNYWLVKAVDEGKAVDLLLTDGQISEAKFRAKRNPSDILHVTGKKRPTAVFWLLAGNVISVTWAVLATLL